MGDGFARVVSEQLSRHTEDDVIDFHHPIRRRFFPDMSDENLPTDGGGPPLPAIKIACSFGIDPAPQTGGTQVIGLVAVHRVVLGEIRQACRILSGESRCGAQAR